MMERDSSGRKDTIRLQLACTDEHGIDTTKLGHSKEVSALIDPELLLLSIAHDDHVEDHIIRSERSIALLHKTALV